MVLFIIRNPQHNDYSTVMGAFGVLDFSDEAVRSIWSLVAAILHIGNMDFDNLDDSEEIRLGRDIVHVF